MRCAALSAAALALAAAHGVSAQTSTTCNPLNETCPPDKALGKTITVDFTQGASDQFSLADGTTLTYGSNGAEFTMVKEDDAPTITSVWYIFFGRVDVTLQAAPGTGIVSSFVMESDDLDEIDMEWLGGDTTQVETNYFGKGNTTTYDRATYVNVAAPQTGFHTYSIIWTSSSVQWLVDGNLVRTLNYGDANGGKNYPQTPMRIKLGDWDGGASNSPEGTVQWAGGHSDMSKGPFTMYVKSMTIQDYSTGGSEYVYSDMSGDWQSIKISDGGSESSSSGSSSISSTPSSSSTASSTSSTASSSSLSSTVASAASGASSSVSTSSASAGSSIPGTSVGTAVSTQAPTNPASNFTSASTSPPAATKTGSSGATALRDSGYSVAGAVFAVLGLVLGYMVA